MKESLNSVVIVGGGTAGWITAGLLAAEHCKDGLPTLEIVLVESPDIPTIGVGEGTWPSMRTTLKKIGIRETDFIRDCDASFKQGSRFAGWMDGNSQNFYYHPFTLPAYFSSVNLANYWLPFQDQVHFADAVSSQAAVCEAGLSPKQIATPEYAFNLNYGYHLDAAKFAALLQRHCTKTLGVTHVLENVVDIQRTELGDIRSVMLESGQEIEGDLFVDCTGSAALLIGRYFQVPFVSVGNTLFNDRAIAVQVPYPASDTPIASATLSTAQDKGWTWDIGLQSRRGVGYVYSSSHEGEDSAAEALMRYVQQTSPGIDTTQLSYRSIAINPGYRERFWVKNCVAVGMAAGFIEPLEASALALIEQAAKMISEQLPGQRQLMDVVAKRFNRKFNYHWRQIINFLKLHYAISQRDDTQYWRDCRHENSIPPSLQELLMLWRQQCPWYEDAPEIDELFPAASWQYVLYGMGYQNLTEPAHRASIEQGIGQAQDIFKKNIQATRRFLRSLPANRELINRITLEGLPPN